jgi:hypothetical protein
MYKTKTVPYSRRTESITFIILKSRNLNLGSNINHRATEAGIVPCWSDLALLKYWTQWDVCLSLLSTDFTYDCTFIESLYMYLPYLTYSNKKSTSPVMTKRSTAGYREKNGVSCDLQRTLWRRAASRIHSSWCPAVHFEQAPQTCFYKKYPPSFYDNLFISQFHVY